jgi:toxin YoeB
MKIIFLDQAWDDYLYWQTIDKSMLKKINSLVKEIERTRTFKIQFKRAMVAEN